MSDDDLRRIDLPTAIVPIYDRVHPFISSEHAHSLIPSSRLFDFDPRRHSARTASSLDSATGRIMVAEVLCGADSSQASSQRRQAAALRRFRIREQLRPARRLIRFRRVLIPIRDAFVAARRPTWRKV